MKEQNHMYINGAWQKANGDEFSTLNPATGEVLATFRAATKEDVFQSIDSAERAFTSWSLMTIDQRIHFLNLFVEELTENKSTLAELISQETGKPLWEALTEVNAMINKVPISISSYQERCQTVQHDAKAATSYIRFKPHGVVAVFGPFNLPGHLPNGHIVPAILAGNTCVFKPSEHTPLVGQKYLELWDKVGLPDGVINLIQGSRDTGVALSAVTGLNGLFFTGSSDTGKAIHQSFAGRPDVILALEMGGNNPLVISGIKNIDATVYTIIQSAFITSGQRCTCARRLIVVEDNTTDELLSNLVQRTSQIKVGAYQDSPEPFMGPVISAEAAEQILNRQKEIIYKGGISLLESKNVDHKALVTPGIIDVTQVKDRDDVEIFGPLLQVIRVNDFNAAIREANQTKYGLSAALLSNDVRQYQTFLKLSRAGIVNWNRATTGASSNAPFGGIGESGNHRPSASYATDYCSFPVASMEYPHVSLPESFLPGLNFSKGDNHA